MNPALRIRLLMELRRSGIADTRVLAAVEKVPRELFVEEPFADQAWDNAALPIGCGQTISQPLVVGLMTQALDISGRCKVLEIGTGSGYQTAVLAQLSRRVYTLERHKPLLGQAEARFRLLRLTNIVAMHGDGMRGWPAQAPFERILVTAAARELPQPLLDQLAVGGVLVTPLDTGPERQEVVRVRRTESGFATEALFPVRFVPLVSGVPEDAG
ncbi:L-isoaspartate protein carboxylmethyltransferase type II [uncultured Alphaproteobacteria bacterium]|uniref:Protein-L-isoaspartate O-methyltransferase n=1 Tax=uncultured Alphaproteobacteria bacterium TaxID=91750 RepID=A0A212J2P8_9PROT|nr:L-isoaspartate protein carboxylmethyltransferase type II [uncultured Alphaproteobacteria bacterium]